MMLAGSVLILFFAVYIIQNNAALMGVAIPSEPALGVQAEIIDGVQYVTTVLQPGSYEAIQVKQGIPVEWTIEASKTSLNGCNREIQIPEYDIWAGLQEGENVITFMPEEAGTYSYSCWMGMIRSSIYVTE